jgi:D-psicose/D-tagatose/L-ribulose 3-epimerase
MAERHRVGACTWMFGDMPFNRVAERLERLGFDGVELMGDLALYGPREADQTLSDHGLEVFSLTPDNVDLAHPEAGVRRTAVDYYMRLLDFAAALGRPIVSCHGLVGRFRAIESQGLEWDLFVGSVRQIATRAEELNLRVVMEVLNRYESHLVNTGAQALDFVDAVGSDHVGILLDAYHMNVEEASPADALRMAGDRLWLYHAADSNRHGLGRGHTDFDSQLGALAEIGYDGPIILECPAPGPDPYTAIKDEESLSWLETFLAESRSYLEAKFGEN